MLLPVAVISLSISIAYASNGLNHSCDIVLRDGLLSEMSLLVTVIPLSINHIIHVLTSGLFVPVFSYWSKKRKYYSVKSLLFILGMVIPFHVSQVRLYLNLPMCRFLHDCDSRHSNAIADWEAWGTSALQCSLLPTGSRYWLSCLGLMAILVHLSARRIIIRRNTHKFI